MRRLLILAVAASSLVGAPTAAAANCGTAVLKDWADGKLDRAYPVKCYQDALDAMPEDMRSYTTAPDDIRRALLARLRVTRTHHGQPGARRRAVASAPRATAREALSAAGVTTRATGIPLPLVVLAAIGLVLLLGGSGALLSRRVRAHAAREGP
ncbi:MAG: hypothetical protein E6G22_02585 [Actinobacteria bacterium]|nr:MAG: hypothetical protein E6G22_02585 [Actinomycetota bacterium]